MQYTVFGIDGANIQGFKSDQSVTINDRWIKIILMTRDTFWMFSFNAPTLRSL